MSSEFYYIDSQRTSGLTDLMNPPKGVVLEIGGGDTPRFSHLGKNAPRVVNIEREDNATGDRVIEEDISNLHGSLSDPRVQEVLQQEGGAGTIIFSHILSQLVVIESIRTILRSAVEELMPGGTIWIMNLIPEWESKQVHIEMRRSRSVLDQQRNKGDLQNIHSEIAAGIAEATRICMMRKATLVPYFRTDIKEKLEQTAQPNRAKKFLEFVRENKISFVFAEQNREINSFEKVGPATHNLLQGSQEVIVLSKGENPILEHGWGELKKRKDMVIEQHAEWKRMKNKRDRNK